MKYFIRKRVGKLQIILRSFPILETGKFYELSLVLAENHSCSCEVSYCIDKVELNICHFLGASLV